MSRRSLAALIQIAVLQNSSLIEMNSLPNAILAARPPIATAPVMPPAPVRPIGGAGTAAPARGGGRALPSAIMAIAPPADAPKRGRPDKAEREREKRRAASERIAAFAETKPSRRAVREFFGMRIAELMDD